MSKLFDMPAGEKSEITDKNIFYHVSSGNYLGLNKHKLSHAIAFSTARFYQLYSGSLHTAQWV